MGWTAANKQSTEDTNKTGGKTVRNDEDEPSNEAIVARLTSTYNAAMICVNSLHRASMHMIQTSQSSSQDLSQSSKMEENRDILKSTAYAAREGFELILKDPVIASLAPGLFGLLTILRDTDLNRDDLSDEDRNEFHLWFLLSKTTTFHEGSPFCSSTDPVVLAKNTTKNSIRDLCYLSLVNYADLLTCCSPYRNKDILPYKVSVHSVPQFQVDTCWNDLTCENKYIHEAIMRKLVLIAYLDATAIDNSDPTLWLRTASACQSLSSTLDSMIEVAGSICNDSRIELMYERIALLWRLEKYCLECGYLCLSKGFPVNRSVQSALDNFRKRSLMRTEVVKYNDDIFMRSEKHLKMSRCSFVSMGLSIIESCHDGLLIEEYPQRPKMVSTKAKIHSSIFMSPIIKLSISPLLTIPTQIIGVIVEFLQPCGLNVDIRNLECTCRSLSTSIIIVRSKEVISNNESNSTDIQGTNSESSGNNYSEDKAPQCKVDKEEQAKQIERPQSYRSSKRVSSRNKSSEKQEERNVKRKSVESLLSAMTQSLIEPNSTKSSDSNCWERCYPCESSISLDDESINNDIIPLPNYKMHSYDLLSNLLTLINESKSTPIKALYIFLEYIALHVHDVFSCEQESILLLSSCLLDGFDQLRRLSDQNFCLTPLWIDSPLSSHQDNGQNIFFINLLQAELLMKKCERLEISSFDQTCYNLGLLVRELLFRIDYMMSIEGKCRCLWLVVTYYRWISTNTSVDPHAALEANQVIISKLNEAISCIGTSSILTSHLCSPGRQGLHWTSISHATLTTFRDELKTSTYLSQARVEYSKYIHRLNENKSEIYELRIPMNELISIKVAGETLFHHFMKSVKPAMMEQVLNDYIDCNLAFIRDIITHDTIKYSFTELLITCDGNESYQKHWGRLWDSFPTSEIDKCVLPTEKVSILSMLAIHIGKFELLPLKLFMQLLRNLIAACRRLYCEGYKKSKDKMDEADDDSDDENDAEQNNNERNHLYFVVMLLLTDKLSLLIAQTNDDIYSSVVVQLNSDLIRLARSLFSCFYKTSWSSMHDFLVFRSTNNLLRSTCRMRKANDNAPSYFAGLAELLVSSRDPFLQLLRSKTFSCRKQHLKICEGMACFVAAVSMCMADCLSSFLSRMSGPKMVFSALLANLMDSTSKGVCPLSQLIVAVNWFWKYISSEKSTSSLAGGLISRQLHQSMTDILQIPTASLLFALCGSIGQNDVQGRCIDLFDFYDTDCSVHPDSDEDIDSDEEIRLLREHLRLSIQVMSNVFEKLPEKRMMVTNVTNNGPLLPLVATRVLTHLADIILQYCKTDSSLNISMQDQYDREEGIWALTYPDHCESMGNEIDDMLSKFYWCLYGISIESATSGLTNNLSEAQYKAESIKGACRLYRCILRIYSKYSKKSLPISALEFVLSSLPSIHEPKLKRSLNDFLFGQLGSTQHLSNPFEFPVTFPTWIFNNTEESGLTVDETHREVYLVRRGLSHHLTSGPIPIMPNERNNESTDERDRVYRYEEALYNKFFAVFEDLCFSPKSYESWFRAGQCVMAKIDIISDRIKMRDCFNTKSEMFCPSMLDLSQATSAKNDNDPGINCDEYVNKAIASFTNIMPFIQYPWSTFSSIHSLANHLLQMNPSDDLKTKLDNLQDLFDREDFTKWQNTWGSIFISSLRLVCHRCFFTALCLAKDSLSKKDNPDTDLVALVAEMSEIVGSHLYSEMQLGIQHGFEITTMSQTTKRLMAENAQVCFEYALELSKLLPEAPLWELRFMIGKCEEKKAKSYTFESFPHANESIRTYEKSMSKALSNYATAWEEAVVFDEEVGIDDTGEGGSSHGKVEIFYRLHSTRLKCLINSIKLYRVRSQAEDEALRLSSKYWFGAKPDEFEGEVTCARERIWQNLTNIVAALAQCRIDSPYFHRSVYRHAQGICWAPMFVPSDLSPIKGSLEILPSQYSCALRGCNSNMSCVESAAGILSVLFDKKRTNLCNVWITKTSNSPFEEINSSLRKFNYLQTKYLQAYVDCLQLCGKRTVLETLISWTRNMKRDFTGYYYASALMGGKPPNHPAYKDCLIEGAGSVWFAKRYINRALVICLKDELIENHSKDSSVDIQEYIEGIYECFARLNISVDKLIDLISRETFSQLSEEVDSLLLVYQTIEKNQHLVGNDKAAILKDAITKLKSLSKQSNLKLQKSSKRKGSQVEADELLNENVETKRSKIDPTNSNVSEVEMVKKYFTVNVPDGLSQGSSFVATIRYGEVSKKVKLKVPSNNSKRLRFQLDIPKDNGKTVTSTKHPSDKTSNFPNDDMK